MSKTYLQDVVRQFLRSSDPEVLCLRGKWGVGKTYAWKDWLATAAQLKDVGKKEYAYCSLFGVGSLAELKASILENTVPVDDLSIDTPSLATFKKVIDRGKQLARQGSWATGFIISALPHGGKLGDAAARLLFLTVRNQLICIDDLERKGSTLSAGDVLGLISTLKDERKCKVVLILNDEELKDEADKVAFERYLEKVIDLSAVFAPSPDECIKIGLGGESPVNAELERVAKILDITNIRVIKRIKHLALSLVPLLQGRDPALLREVVKSLTALGWVHFMPGNDTPPIDFLERRYLPYTEDRLENKGTPPQQRRWNELLRDVGMLDFTELDHALLRGVKAGYFDHELVSGFAELVEKRMRKAELQRRLNDAWRVFWDSLSANEDEVVKGFREAVEAGVNALSPPEVDKAVRLLRQLNRQSDASHIVQFYVANRNAERGFFSSWRRGSQRIFDPEMMFAFREKEELERVARPLGAVIRSIGNGVQSEDDMEHLRNASIQDFVDGFAPLTGNVLKRAIETCLQSTEGPDGGETVAAKARKALDLYAEQSPINKLRVTGYVTGQVPLDDEESS